MSVYRQELKKLQQIFASHSFSNPPPPEAIKKIHDENLEYCLATYIANKCFEIKKLNRNGTKKWLVQDFLNTSLSAGEVVRRGFPMNYHQTVASFFYAICQSPPTTETVATYNVAYRINENKTDKEELEIRMASACWRGCFLCHYRAQQTLAAFGVSQTPPQERVYQTVMHIYKELKKNKKIREDNATVIPHQQTNHNEISLKNDELSSLTLKEFFQLDDNGFKGLFKIIKNQDNDTSPINESLNHLTTVGNHDEIDEYHSEEEEGDLLVNEVFQNQPKKESHTPVDGRGFEKDDGYSKAGNDKKQNNNTTSHPISGNTIKPDTPYFTFEGRLRRRDFWPKFLAITIPFMIVGGFISAIPGDGATGFNVILNLLMIIALAPLCVKRLHDVGITGVWWIFSIIPIVYIGVLITMMLDSQKKPNRWGPSPKGL